jgi:hypothetical protein
MDDMSFKITKLINQINVEIVNYFNSIRFEIEANANSLVRENAKISGDQKQLKKLEDIKLKMIKQVDKVHQYNIETINAYFHSISTKKDDYILFNFDAMSSNEIKINLERLKAEILKGYCFFLAAKNLNESVKSNPIGLLITTDWYLDTFQLNYLKYAF